MTRLFWRFFLAIWIALAGSILFVFGLNTFLGILPPKGERIADSSRFSRDIAVSLIVAGKVQSARDIVGALNGGDPSVAVSIETVSMPQGCKPIDPPHGPPDIVFAEYGGNCYRLALHFAKQHWTEVFVPPSLPFVSALLASLLSSWLLTKYLIRPVNTLRAGLSALAKGMFSVRIGNQIGYRKDEVAALGKDFDVTAAKLEELQEGQRRLFHDVSHELRSPLTRLQAAAGILRQNPAKLDAILPRFDREIERMDSMVEEILTLARLGTQSGQTPEWQRLDVIDLIGAITEDAAFEAEPRGMAIEYSGLDHFVAQVNGELIYRAIENVMRNAVKYGADGSTIGVATSLANSGQDLRIAIRNEGQPIEAEDVERIFTPFVRLLDTENSPGHGLGLAITREAVALHGGHVWAKANAGGGLTVILDLPRQPPARTGQSLT